MNRGAAARATATPSVLGERAGLVSPGQRPNFADILTASVYKMGRAMTIEKNKAVPEAVAEFISCWSAATASERSNSQLFLSELCGILETPPPDPKPNSGYAFEFGIEEHHPDGTTSHGWIDLHKRGCFVLESKQFQEAIAKRLRVEKPWLSS